MPQTISHQPTIVFLGTARFAVEPLLSLYRKSLEGHIRLIVVTGPDTRRGRGLKLLANPVKEAMMLAGRDRNQPCMLFQPHLILDLKDELASYHPQLMVVVAYGEKIPAEIDALATHGCVNLHPSLLPRWRGAAPVTRCILKGDPYTGISLMKIDSGIDTGPVFKTIKIPVASNDTTLSLENKLSVLGAEMLVCQLNALLEGKITPNSQELKGVSYAPKITQKDALINWNEQAEVIERQIRAMQPKPLAHTFLENRRLQIHKAKVDQENSSTNGLHHPKKPGQMYCDETRKRLWVTTASKRLEIEQLRLEGGKLMSAKQWIDGRRLQAFGPVGLAGVATK